jgi:hypothetical protein
MGKRVRFPEEHRRRDRDGEWPDSLNPDRSGYDDVMDIYADQLDPATERCAWADDQNDENDD